MHGVGWPTPGRQYPPAAQTAGPTEPMGHDSPAGHAAHASFPPTGLYVPGAQGGHGPPSGPVCPGSHEQFSHHDDWAGEVEFAGHGFATPVQHHVLARHAEHGALATPS